jgi:hypothetical protein
LPRYVGSVPRNNSKYQASAPEKQTTAALKTRETSRKVELIFQNSVKRELHFPRSTSECNSTLQRQKNSSHPFSFIADVMYILSPYTQTTNKCNVFLARTSLSSGALSSI